MQIRCPHKEDVMKGKKSKVIAISIFFFLCGSFCYITSNEKEEEQLVVLKEEVLETTVTKTPEEQAKEKIYVHVCGAVVNPGVYELEKGARVYTGIQMAGGVLENAAQDFMNQAAELTDGERLYVPTVSEIEQGSEVTKTESEEDSRVNINTASKEELMTLPGIGESKAESVIQYREEHGEFKEVEELTNIPGIKSGVYEKIKELVRIR